MFDTVECPYCNFENDMSEGTIDLPSDNKFDHECTNCEREFEIFVEFIPSYGSVAIEYVDCEKCGRETRDIKEKGKIFPYPESLKETRVCFSCYGTAYAEELSNQKISG